MCCFTEQAYSIFEIGREGVIAEIKDRPLFLDVSGRDPPSLLPGCVAQ